MSHRSSRDNRLQPVHRDQIGFIPDLENKKISQSIREPCKDLCRGATAEVLKHHQVQTRTQQSGELKVEVEAEAEG